MNDVDYIRSLAERLDAALSQSIEDEEGAHAGLDLLQTYLTTAVKYGKSNNDGK